MHLMIIGSMTFAKEMLATQKHLIAMGHTVDLPTDTETHVQNPALVDDLATDLVHSRETDVIRKCFDLVAKSDAIVVLNYPKNNIDGYLGTSVLMEIGLAYYLGKNIFLLNPIPPSDEVRWAHEITVMDPVILNGDLNKIIAK